MILAVDVGNTNIVIGAYEGKQLLGDWRISTDRHRTADEYGVTFRGLLANRGLRTSEIRGVVLCCVVPPLLGALQATAREFNGCEPMVMGPHLATGIVNRYEEPQHVGADRLVNAVAAVELYGAPAILADFGTATTVDVVSANREYLGGAIAPGIAISADALFRLAASLPRIELVKPQSAIGTKTIHSMQSGIVFGYVGLVKELISRIRAEIGTKAKVIATGGLASLIAPEIDGIDIINPHLTLEGLRMVWEMNQ